MRHCSDVVAFLVFMAMLVAGMCFTVADLVDGYSPERWCRQWLPERPSLWADSAVVEQCLSYVVVDVRPMHEVVR